MHIQIRSYLLRKVSAEYSSSQTLPPNEAEVFLNLETHNHFSRIFIKIYMAVCLKNVHFVYYSVFFFYFQLFFFCIISINKRQNPQNKNVTPIATLKLEILKEFKDKQNLRATFTSPLVWKFHVIDILIMSLLWNSLEVTKNKSPGVHWSLTSDLQISSKQEAHTWCWAPS